MRTAEPKEEGGSARATRKFCEDSEMCVVTSFPEIGATYMGSRGDTKIDHFLVCNTARKRIQQIKKLWSSVRRLTLFKTRKFFDHIPVLAVLDVEVSRALRRSPAVHTADRDLLTECLLPGQKRNKLMAAVEKEVNEIDGEEWCALRGQARKSRCGGT